ncbi:MAG TPA: glycosyltransferase family 4 protein [Mycobacteriales bacterium]|nr:glycosyltransferase family 4 protein [Mycobacteriales bacterium]
MRIGLVCPYVWDLPGGVQAHVRDLAETLLGLGHEVSVLTPVGDDAALPDYCVDAGRPVPVPYNGSVARLLLGPVSAGRTRRWLRQGGFDLIHVHEPVAPSVALLACYFADGPVVATFHTANPRSRAMTTFEPFFVPALEKVRGRIAVSEAARRTTVEHLGGDAVLIPNGVAVARYARAMPFPGHPDGRTLVFLGRADEPRKGLAVLLEAMSLLPPDVRLLVAGPGEVSLPPSLSARVELLGRVSEQDKAALLRSADIYVAPNTGGESFGIVLLEAMAAGAPVIASDLDAFRRVLAGGHAGVLFPTGDAPALAAAAAALLSDPSRRGALQARGRQEVQRYDWTTVGAAIVQVYETVLEGAALTAPGGR